MILQFLQVPYPRYNFHSFMCVVQYLYYTHTTASLVQEGTGLQVHVCSNRSYTGCIQRFTRTILYTYVPCTHVCAHTPVHLHTHDGWMQPRTLIDHQTSLASLSIFASFLFVDVLHCRNFLVFWNDLTGLAAPPNPWIRIQAFSFDLLVGMTTTSHTGWQNPPRPLKAGSIFETDGYDVQPNQRWPVPLLLVCPSPCVDLLFWGRRR